MEPLDGKNIPHLTPSAIRAKQIFDLPRQYNDQVIGGHIELKPKVSNITQTKKRLIELSGLVHGRDFKIMTRGESTYVFRLSMREMILEA